MVREAAAEVRAFLGELGITAFPKTTGNRGLHLYVRVEPGWTRSPCARRPWRWPARWSAAGPT